MTLVCACGGASQRHKDFDEKKKSELKTHAGSLDLLEGRAVTGRPRHPLARVVSDALSGRMWFHHSERLSGGLAGIGSWVDCASSRKGGCETKKQTVKGVMTAANHESRAKSTLVIRLIWVRATAFATRPQFQLPPPPFPLWLPDSPEKPAVIYRASLQVGYSYRRLQERVMRAINEDNRNP